MSEKNRFEYSPKWAPHVTALIDEPEIGEDGMREVQNVDATCGTCKETMHRPCSSGLVRQHVDRFATIHFHRDPLATAGAKNLKPV